MMKLQDRLVQPRAGEVGEVRLELAKGPGCFPRLSFRRHPVHRMSIFDEMI